MGGKTAIVSRIIRHPRIDAAILMLDQSLASSRMASVTIKPAKLPHPFSDEPKMDNRIMVSGWYVIRLRAEF